MMLDTRMQALDSWRLVASFVAVAAVLSLGATPVAQGQIACSYETIAVIQAPAGPVHQSPTFATAISPNGQHVVGWYRFDAVGPDLPWYWSQATGFITLPLPPGFSDASPADINNSRVVVGTGWQNGYQRGFVYDMNSGQFTITPPLGGFWSGANAINEQGVVTGTTTIVHDGNPIYPVAYTWNGSVLSQLGLLDGQGHYGIDIAEDGKVIVSPLAPSFGPHAGIWDGQSVQNLGPIPGGESSSGVEIEIGSHVVGSGSVAGSNPAWPLPFHYIYGQMLVLPVLGGVYDRGNALALNATGTIVGSCRRNVNPPRPRACVWQEGQVRNLNMLTPPGGDPILQHAVGIDDDGRIICEAINLDADTVAVILDPVMAAPGDSNCDNAVDVTDLLQVILTWGEADSTGDLNSDDQVDVTDLLIVIANWSTL